MSRCARSARPLPDAELGLVDGVASGPALRMNRTDVVGRHVDLSPMCQRGADLCTPLPIGIGAGPIAEDDVPLWSSGCRHVQQPIGDPVEQDVKLVAQELGGIIEGGGRHSDGSVGSAHRRRLPLATDAFLARLSGRTRLVRGRSSVTIRHVTELE